MQAFGSTQPKFI